MADFFSNIVNYLNTGVIGYLVRSCSSLRLSFSSMSSAISWSRAGAA